MERGRNMNVLKAFMTNQSQKKKLKTQRDRRRGMILRLTRLERNPARREATIRGRGTKKIFSLLKKSEREAETTVLEKERLKAKARKLIKTRKDSKLRTVKESRTGRRVEVSCRSER